MRKGPLIIYGDENPLIKRTARNLPGIDTCSVHRLNLLQLAPGGHLGRFLIFTKDAFKALNTVFGNYRRKGVEKGGYVLNRSVMTVADLARIINSDQVQSKLRGVKTHEVQHDLQKRNPLKNRSQMQKLNPFDAKRREIEKKLEADRHAKKAAALKAKRSKAGRKTRTERGKKLRDALGQLDTYIKRQEDDWAKDEVKEEEDEDEDEDEEDDS